MIFLTSKLGKLSYPYTKSPRYSCILSPLKIQIINGKNLEANAKALHALKSTLNDEYLSRATNLDSVFVIWNIICSLEEQTPHDKENDSDD